jgi:hypothetical protein
MHVAAIRNSSEVHTTRYSIKCERHSYNILLSRPILSALELSHARARLLHGIYLICKRPQEIGRELSLVVRSPSYISHGPVQWTLMYRQ